MSTYRLNRRLLLVSGVVSIAAGIGIVTTHAWQISKTAQSMLAHADAQEQESKWLEAAEYLDRYLRMEPGNREARVRLATDYANGADTFQQKLRAVELHYKALGLEELLEQSPLRERLAELLLETGRFVEAEAEARKLLTRQENSPAARRLLALSIYRQYERGELETADFKTLGLLSMVKMAHGLNEHDVPLAVILATLYRDHPKVVNAEPQDESKKDRAQLADEALDQLVQKNPDSAQAHLARFVYRTQYRLEGAKIDADEAQRLAPNDPLVLRTLASASLDQAQTHSASGLEADAVSNYQHAQKLFSDLVTKRPRLATPEVYLGLGEAYWGLGKPQLALETWREGLKKFAQPTVVAQFHARLADAYMDRKEFLHAQESLQAIDQILKEIVTSIPRRELLAMDRRQKVRQASWDLRSGLTSKAIDSLLEIVTDKSAADLDIPVIANAWMLLGSIYKSSEQSVKAAQAFDQAVALQPETAAARIAAASAWLSADRLDLALDHAQAALRHLDALSPQECLEARLLEASCLLQLQLEPDRPVKNRDWTKVKQSLAVLEGGQSPTALLKAPWRIDFLRAEFAFYQATDSAQLPQAREIAAGILKLADTKYGTSAEFLSELCPRLEQFGLSEDADRVLNHLQQLQGKSFAATMTAVRLATSRKQYDLAISELDQAAKDGSPAELGLLLDERIRIALENRDLDLARSLLLQQYHKNPADLAVIRRLADIDLERRELKLLETWKLALAKLESQGQPFYLYYHTCRLIFSSRAESDPELRKLGLQAAQKAQRQLATLRPEWSETYALLGMIEQERGDRAKAVIAFERACQQGDPRLYVFERLIGLLEELNRGNEAEKYLSRLQLQLPRSQRLTEFASNRYLQQLKPDQAVTTARLAVENRPDDPSAHAWLGRMLLLSNRREESEQEFSKVLELAPHDVNSWHSLFSYYLRIGKKDRAQAVLKDLAEKAPLEKGDRSFLLGQGYELLGDVETAIRFYEEAAESAPEGAAIQFRMAGVLLRSYPQCAEVCLRKAMQLEPTNSNGRRMLASLLASRGTDDGFKEAESLLQDYKADDLASVEDQRLRALLMSQKGGQAGINRAVELIEELLQGSNGTAGDRLFLAQLYEFQARQLVDSKSRQMKLEQAKQQLLAVATAPNSEIPHLSAAIEFLARTNQEKEVSQWLNRFEERLTAASQDQVDPIVAYLQLKIRFQKGEGCETWLSRLEAVDHNPVRPLTLRAKALIAQDRQPEALRLIDSAGRKRAGTASDQREKLVVYQGLGDLLFSMDEFSAAETWYRQLYSVEPRRFEYLVAAFAKQGKYSEVQRVCEIAAKSDKSSKPAIVLGNSVFEASWTLEQIAQADPFLKAALDQFPDDPGLLYTVGLVRIVQDRSDDAIALFQKLVTLEPRNVAALNNLALLLADRPAERKQALQLIDRAIEISGMDPSLLDTKGIILVNDGQAPKSVFLLQSAASSPNSDPRYRLHLALAYREIGDWDKAKRELAQALSQKVESLQLTSSDRRLLSELKRTIASN